MARTSSRTVGSREHANSKTGGTIADSADFRQGAAHEHGEDGDSSKDTPFPELNCEGGVSARAKGLDFRFQTLDIRLEVEITGKLP
jgi:hypothetical protein